jgi:hypothetical protein
MCSAPGPTWSRRPTRSRLCCRSALPWPDGCWPGGLRAAKLIPLLLVVLLGYLAGLAREISQPPVAAQNQQLASWLAARHLHTGLSGH